MPGELPLDVWTAYLAEVVAVVAPGDLDQVKVATFYSHRIGQPLAWPIIWFMTRVLDVWRGPVRFRLAIVLHCLSLMTTKKISFVATVDGGLPLEHDQRFELPRDIRRKQVLEFLDKKHLSLARLRIVIGKKRVTIVPSLLETEELGSLLCWTPRYRKDGNFKIHVNNNLLVQRLMDMVG